VLSAPPMPDERRIFSEQRLLGLARIVAIGVVLALIAFTIVLDPLFIHPQKPVDDVVLGLLIGALLTLLGLAGLERLSRRNGNGA